MGQIGFHSENNVPWLLRVLTWQGSNGKGKKPEYDKQFPAMKLLRTGAEKASKMARFAASRRRQRAK